MQATLAAHLPRAMGMMDVSWEHPEHYTALGCLFFASAECDLQRYNYDVAAYDAVLPDADDVSWASSCAYVLKVHFDKGQFGQVKNVRKGCQLTKWMLNGQPLQLANVHLFHDAHNIIASTKVRHLDKCDLSHDQMPLRWTPRLP